MAMTPPVYANQFFPGAGPQPQDVYSQQDMMNAMVRSIPQFTGSNGVPTTPQANQSNFSASPSPPNPTGPSANNRKLGLYKTELCRSWEEKGTCRYGPKCQFAHGEEELRKVARHPKASLFTVTAVILINREFASSSTRLKFAGFVEVVYLCLRWIYV